MLTPPDKPTITWAEFQEEDALVVWQKRAQRHRLEGCVECLAGGCITGGVKTKLEERAGDETHSCSCHTGWPQRTEPCPICERIGCNFFSDRNEPSE